jgi:hypothetical protein
MILTAHQPAYLPWLGLFHKIALADVFIFMDDVKYSKSDYSNRNYIKHPEGRKHLLTIPVKTGGADNVTFVNLPIDNSQNWRRSHLATIDNFYRKAPHKQMLGDLSDNYRKEHVMLSDLTYEMLLFFLGKLGIKTRVMRASLLGLKESGNDYLIELCKTHSCDVYIFGALGRDYADLAAFESAGINAMFQDYHHPVYPQLHGDFVSHLSIVDLLFNCGASSLDILMSGNMTKEDIPRTYEK